MDPILRRELIAAGTTDAEIRTAVRRERLTPLATGAYAETQRYRELERDDRYVLKVRAAASRSPGLVVSHASAAALHGLPQYGLDRSAVHLTRPGHGGNRRTAHRVVHAGRLPGASVVDVDGLAVTDLSRTVIDVARTEPYTPAVAIADAALRADEGIVGALPADLMAATRSLGRPQAQRVLAAADGRAESVGEKRLRLQLLRAGLAAPALQIEVFDERGRLLGRVGAGYPEHGVLIEFDGMVKYERLRRPGESASDAVIREKAREERITELGWLVIRFVWKDLRSPERVAARVRSARAARRRFAGAIRGRWVESDPITVSV